MVGILSTMCFMLLVELFVVFRFHIELASCYFKRWCVISPFQLSVHWG